MEILWSVYWGPFRTLKSATAMFCKVFWYLRVAWPTVFWRGFVSKMSRFFKSAQHIFHFASLDFHIIPGGFPCLPGGKLLSGLTRRIIENFTFFPLSRAVHTRVPRQGLIYLR